MVDVFISYSRRDSAKVSMLARAIADEGYVVWWDEELPPHRSYGDVITDKIAMANAALVVWSKDSVQSEWVRAEADMARNQRKLIQTSLDGVMPPLPFNQIQYAPIGDWQGEPDHSGWRKVKASLSDLCGPRGGGEAMPLHATPQPQPQFAPASGTPKSKAPLFAGIAIAGAALIGVGAFWLGQRGAAPDADSPVAVSFETGTGTGNSGLAPAPQPGSASTAPAAPAADVPAAPPAPIAAEPAPVAAPPQAYNPADMTFPDSSTRLLLPSELAGFGPATLRVARNEIYARKGRRFRDPWLRNYFSNFSWYQPRFDDVPLNPIERRNVALIREAEARYR